jgi:hypothetical protein
MKNTSWLLPGSSRPSLFLIQRRLTIACGRQPGKPGWNRFVKELCSHYPAGDTPSLLGNPGTHSPARFGSGLSFYGRIAATSQRRSVLQARSGATSFRHCEKVLQVTCVEITAVMAPDWPELHMSKGLNSCH